MVNYKNLTRIWNVKPSLPKKMHNPALYTKIKESTFHRYEIQPKVSKLSLYTRLSCMKYSLHTNFIPFIRFNFTMNYLYKILNLTKIKSPKTLHKHLTKNLLL